MPKILRALLLISMFLFLAAAETRAEDQEITLTAKNSKLQLVKMTVFKNPADLIKKQPATHDVVKTIQNSDKKSHETTQLSLGQVQDAKNKILVVQASSRMYCGSAGCTTRVYLDNGNGKGYEPVLSINAGGMIYAFDNNGTAALAFCSGPGVGVWEIKGNDFVLKGALQKPPACY